jgi:hypothetical protein
LVEWPDLHLKSFQITVPEVYKQIHHIVKAEEEPLGLLAKDLKIAF